MPKEDILCGLLADGGGAALTATLSAFFATAIGADGVGTWIDGFAGLSPSGWSDSTFFTDDQGNIFSHSFVFGRDPVFENRNLDFTPNAGSVDSIASVASNSADRGDLFWLLDTDGELFQGRIAP